MAQTPWRIVILLSLLFVHSGVDARGTATSYYPPPHQWQRAPASSHGVDAEKLAAAIRFAQENAVVEPKDLAAVIVESFSKREPNFRLYGPTKPREQSSGLVIKNGYIIGEWGDLKRVDMTFSVTKSYLSTIAALALRDGLIDDLHRPVKNWVPDSFASEHNHPISWHHLLQQTSDWQGRLWNVHDWADRPEGDKPSEWPKRELHPPGTYFKYNDVRVNLLAYALMQVWREPLPQILKREVMRPIGASNTWRWHGYENSWVTLDGLKMQSVSGGGHFGGGMFINTLDHARFGLLFLRNGRWGEQQIIPEDWIKAMREPTKVRPDYGYMWWLNTNQERIPAAPESAYYAAGFGGNYIYVDPENDLLIVMRWVPELAPAIEKFLQALN